ncbi:MAG: hypothetical protein ABWX92_16195 [Mycetocola sp.]
MAGLNTYVHVRDEHGVDHAFGPGDSVPKWARESITNPDVWEGDSEESSDETTTSTEPPRSGKGSGAKAWATHAESLGIEVPDGAKAPDIIALVDAQKSDGTNDDTDDSAATEGTIPGDDADVAAWIAYAATNGFEIDVDDDVTVEEIVKVLDANDVKTK